MKQFHYNPDTLQYLGSSDAFPNPEEPGNFIIAAHALPIGPEENLIPAEGQAIGINSNRDDWTIYENKIGEQYYDAIGNEYQIQRLGELLPEWALNTPPVSASEDKARRVAIANLQIVQLIDLTDPDLVDSVDQANVKLLKAWRVYRNQLLALDINATPINWPKVPQ